jgi:hypothetical protein
VTNNLYWDKMLVFMIFFLAEKKKINFIKLCSFEQLIQGLQMRVSIQTMWLERAINQSNFCYNNDKH